MENRECKHLKSRSIEDKHPIVKGRYEHPQKKLICGICNTFFKYKKRNPNKIELNNEVRK